MTKHPKPTKPLWPSCFFCHRRAECPYYRVITIFFDFVPRAFGDSIHFAYRRQADRCRHYKDNNYPDPSYRHNDDNFFFPNEIQDVYEALSHVRFDFDAAITSTASDCSEYTPIPTTP